MFAWLNFWRKRTVEEITQPITKIVDRLQAHADAHVALSDYQNSVASIASAAASAATNEAKKAISTANKIASLIS